MKMQIVWPVFLISLGVGQLIASRRGWRGASLAGPHRRRGYGLALLLIAGGWRGLAGLSLPQDWAALGWAFPAGPLALAVLLLGGSYLNPPPHPDAFFAPRHPRHGGCRRLAIADGPHRMPALWLKPLPRRQTGAAVCLIHGAGDTKHGYKWRLVRALLDAGLAVLSIDLPGHGEYRRRPLRYPDCLSAVPAAIAFLRAQPEVKRVGLLGLSLGGALALKSVAEFAPPVDALAILETPLRLNFSRALVWREGWQALRAPALSVLAEISLRQIRQSWRGGGYTSPHTTAALFDLLNPAESIGRLSPQLPLLLVYSRRDPIAPLEFGEKLHKLAPQAQLMRVNRASHVTLILMPDVNLKIAAWFKASLQERT